MTDGPLRPVPRAGGCGGGEEGQAATGTQTLIWARAVSAGTCGPPGGKLSRVLVVRSRWRLRSMSTRRRARLARALSRFAVIAEAGRLAVAVPARVVVMTARRAAVKEISRGWTGWPGALALAGGHGDRRGGAGCRAGQLGGGHPGGVFLRDQGGEADRSIGPVDGPAPLIADLASFKAVSDPIHRQ